MIVGHDLQISHSPSHMSPASPYTSSCPRHTSLDRHIARSGAGLTRSHPVCQNPSRALLGFPVCDTHRTDEQPSRPGDGSDRPGLPQTPGHAAAPPTQAKIASHCLCDEQRRQANLHSHSTGSDEADVIKWINGHTQPVK